ncbi:C40 family peptidase [Deinococcus peraridilitoris]|uniref:Cell wall-associated hydrolase, invasion-associated protein n=1 Tax=Deinococcus peraridilitoris (strain DSM 19664 / LMG 22246 / CIP 109416 / KR-200) TaxID=937777 RepID=L0A380_DEIPD|nr:C40 family peptidase [Deinococcus peraridilitoris]AFZ67617.1 cell wall-associated hydrolase, invasion-associated protein [Deinococcus peraridilitoris DSM 19664]
MYSPDTAPLPDPRVHAFDEQRRVAEDALRGELPGEWTWLTPQKAVAARGRVSLRERPTTGSAQVTEALHGEAMQILEVRDDGWAWVRTLHDDYLGFACQRALGRELPASATVRVSALRGHLFAAPRVSATLLDEVSHGALFELLDREAHHIDGRRWWRVRYAEGEAFLQAALTAPDASQGQRSLHFARRFLDTPYVWGGRSAWGIDCSGLTQLFYPAGVLPRDADQQQAFLTPTDTPRAGDLAFFPGHVGIMLNEREMLHANATHMRVTIETLGEGEYGARLARELRGFGQWVNPGRDTADSAAVSAASADLHS